MFLFLLTYRRTPYTCTFTVISLISLRYFGRDHACAVEMSFAVCLFLCLFSRLLLKCSLFWGKSNSPAVQRCRLTKAVLINLSRRSPLTDLAERYLFFFLSSKRAASVSNLPHTHHGVCVQVCVMIKNSGVLQCFLTHAATMLDTGAAYVPCWESFISPQVSRCVNWELKDSQRDSGDSAAFDRTFHKFRARARATRHHICMLVPPVIILHLTATSAPLNCGQLKHFKQRNTTVQKHIQQNVTLKSNSAHSYTPGR